MHIYRCYGDFCSYFINGLFNFYLAFMFGMKRGRRFHELEVYIWICIFGNIKEIHVEFRRRFESFRETFRTKKEHRLEKTFYYFIL